MPNVEIHMPFEVHHNPPTPFSIGPCNVATQLATEIRQRCEDKPFFRDMVISHHNTVTFGMGPDGWGIPSPYIRICATKLDEIDTLVEVLGDLADIETLLLTGFKPKRKKRE